MLKPEPSLADDGNDVVGAVETSAMARLTMSSRPPVSTVNLRSHETVASQICNAELKVSDILDFNPSP
jgi:hypothetical protein